MQAHSLARSGGGIGVPRSRKLLAAFSDERLVEQLRRGNDVAFEVVYDRHHRGVLSYCRHMLGSQEEAEDALQQAFISAHASILANDKEIRFKAWIYTIARNRCLSMLRARREQPSDDLERISTAGLSDEVQQRADLQELISDMQELPEEQRAALILSELGDLSHNDVAQIIGCEVAKVKSLVFQARSGLMERREARETPCEEIREQIATLRGGSLRRGPLRRHMKACPGCAAFREDVKRQRQMVAAILPVIPTLGLKESALAAVGMSASAGGGAAAIGGGTGAIVAAKTGVAKVVVIALATTGAVGGGVAVQQAAQSDSDRGGSSTGGQVDDANGGSTSTPPAPASGAAPASGGADDDSEQDAKARAKKDGDQNGKAKGRAGDKGAKTGQDKDGERGRSEESNGFQPERGSSNGERARDFARGRGKGKKRGLDKQDARAGHNGQARGRADRAPKPKRPKPARPAPKPKPSPADPEPEPQGKKPKPLIKIPPPRNKDGEQPVVPRIPESEQG